MYWFPCSFAFVTIYCGKLNSSNNLIVCALKCTCSTCSVYCSLCIRQMLVTCHFVARVILTNFLVDFGGISIFQIWSSLWRCQSKNFYDLSDGFVTVEWWRWYTYMIYINDYVQKSAWKVYMFMYILRAHYLLCLYVIVFHGYLLLYGHELCKLA